jgi:threonine dehydratase
LFSNHRKLDHKENIRMKKYLFAVLVFAQTSVFAAAVCDQQILKAPQKDFEYVSFGHAAPQQSVQNRRAAGITAASIQHAQFIQKAFGIQATPFYTNAHLNQIAGKLLGHPIDIYMKDETIHPTGSFKDRMPIRFYNTVLTTADQLKKSQDRTKHVSLKVVAVSTGNQGRAGAYASNRANAWLKQQGLQNKFDISAEITMSADALSHKKAAIASLGARIRDHYPDAPSRTIPSYDAAEDLVQKDAKADPEHVLLVPHADENSITGYAVIANEMIDQAGRQHIDLAHGKPGEILMLVPLGSGGILSGTEEISARFPNVYSMGVTAAPADITYRSLRSCKMIRTAEPYAGKLIVDGVMATPEAYSLERIREVAKGVALVNQEDAVYATALLKKNGIVVEPTSALPFAALLLGSGDDFKHVQHALIVLTGKNISAEMEQKIAGLAEMDEGKLLDYFVRRRSEILGGIIWSFEKSRDNA